MSPLGVPELGKEAGRGMVAQVARVGRSARWKEGGSSRLGGADPIFLGGGVGGSALCRCFLPPAVAKNSCPYSGSGCPNLGLALGKCRGQETSRDSPPIPPRCWVGGSHSLWVLGDPPLTVLSRCRWGEEQLPDGQTQKYWVSLAGGAQPWGAAASPRPCGVRLDFFFWGGGSPR